MEVRDTIQETGIKTIPKKKKCKKARWLSEEALQIAVTRREVKSKGEKERYTHVNAEFQGIARRDKKAFLSDQCKEIKENNKMRKTRDLFKKIGDTKGTFHAKMGSIKVSLKSPPQGSSGGAVGENPSANAGDSFSPRSRKIPHAVEQLSPLCPNY